MDTSKPKQPRGSEPVILESICKICPSKILFVAWNSARLGACKPLYLEFHNMWTGGFVVKPYSCKVFFVLIHSSDGNHSSPYERRCMPVNGFTVGVQLVPQRHLVWPSVLAYGVGMQRWSSCSPDNATGTHWCPLFQYSFYWWGGTSFSCALFVVATGWPGQLCRSRLTCCNKDVSGTYATEMKPTSSAIDTIKTIWNQKPSDFIRRSWRMILKTEWFPEVYQYYYAVVDTAAWRERKSDLGRKAKIVFRSSRYCSLGIALSKSEEQIRLCACR